MDKAFTGGCACGAVRYEIDGAPMFQNLCQCRQCQQASGAGHGAYLSFDRADVRMTGEVARWTTHADNGGEKTRSFCGVCGSPIAWTFAVAPQVVAVHAASLDAPQRFTPQAVTYASRALAWDAVAPGLARFETMPGA